MSAVVHVQPQQEPNVEIVSVARCTTIPANDAPRDWTSGTFACFSDMSSCITGTLCPVWLLVQNSLRMNEGACYGYCCPGALFGLRIKMRLQQNIEGSLLKDAFMSSACAPCTMCQLARELNHVGAPEMNRMARR